VRGCTPTDRPTDLQALEHLVVESLDKGDHVAPDPDFGAVGRLLGPLLTLVIVLINL
jgi:hypothetical protein